MPDPAEIVVFVLLDAFRHDYLGRTRFLADIAPRSVVGRLEEPFGFCPRAAYFGGLTPSQQGFSNVFRFDPDRSPFRWTRELCGHGREPLVRDLLRPDIMQRARAKVPAFAAAYLDPLDIPLEWLGYFDVCEREAPWSRAVGYRSLFHLLEDAGKKWCEVSWPYADWRGRISDGRCMGEALARLRREHSFAFIHLPDLDALGHRFGPGARETQGAIEETDRLCEMLCGHLTKMFDDPVIVFAGDHGMLPVVRTVDVAAPLMRCDFRWGHDYAFFVDSTMLRVWLLTDEARRDVPLAVERGGGGHWLTEDERQRWGMAGMDRRNADAIFLADPGVVFSPSFFDWSGKNVPRGMHGYAPDVGDNQALFLAHRPRGTWSGDAGVVEAKRLFPSFLNWLGWNAADYTTLEPVTEKARPAGRSRWSASGGMSGDTVVDTDLQRIVDAVLAHAHGTDAIIVAGGFGRGEGTIAVGDAEGSACRALNDYDVVAIGAQPEEISGLDHALAQELGIDFVDLWARPDLPVPDKLSQFDFDLRYGSRLLWGNPLVLDRWPRFAPAQLGLDEGVFQIGNRAGGMLLGLCGRSDGADSAAEFLQRQTAKFLIAVADCWLMAVEDYHPSYILRRERFGALAASGGFSSLVKQWIDRAFAFKLGLDRWHALPSREAAALAESALEELLPRLRGAHRDFDLPAEVSTVACRHIHASGAWMEQIGKHGLQVSEAGRAEPARCVAAVYRACVEGLRHWTQGGDVCSNRVAGVLSPCFQFAREGKAMELPRTAAEAWLSFFH